MKGTKFRAWDGKKLIYKLHMNSNGAFWNTDHKKGEVVFYKNVMQYIGMKDKNGIEIYEGDIIVGIGRVGVIVFENGKYFPKGNIPHCQRLIELDLEEGFSKVVGNVYDNKIYDYWKNTSKEIVQEYIEIFKTTYGLTSLN